MKLLAWIGLFSFAFALIPSSSNLASAQTPISFTFTGTGTGNGQGGRFGEYSTEPQPGVVTVDVLNRLIRDNPNNMTAAIRDWMSRGVKPE